MAKNKRGKNNNPNGRNQYSGWMDSARDRPFTAAATAAAAVGAGVFLWSKRNQISDQLSQLSDQVGEWRDARMANDSTSETAGRSAQSKRGSPRKSQADISAEALTLKETGRTEPAPA